MIDISSFFNHTLPQYCLLCGGIPEQGALCRACEADLPHAPAARCPRCALANPAGTLCGRCLRRPPAFDATYAAFDFLFPLDELLRRYKYQGLLAVGATSADLMLKALPNSALPQRLLPMPLHPERLKERGFNQAAELAKRLGWHLGIPVNTDACQRIRHTAPQAGLSLKDRLKNLRGAFTCDEDLSGCHIALIDDVMTTGSSLNELAKAVKQAGAARIDCWVVARAQRE